MGGMMAPKGMLRSSGKMALSGCVAGADELNEVEGDCGPATPSHSSGGVGVGVGLPDEIDRTAGPTPPSPWPDPATAELCVLVGWWRRFEKMRKGMVTAHQPENMVEEVAGIERKYRRAVEKALKAHPLWPWLEQYPGLRGPYVAWLIARIRDPRRFPGQQCDQGHYLPAIYPVGAPCPVEIMNGDEKRTGRGGAPQDADAVDEDVRDRGSCGAPIGLERRGTGVRSLWHYFGAHVVDGHAPRRKKGQKATWVTEARGILFGPTGIADQIVRQRPEPYRSIYDMHKERLIIARGVENISEAEGSSGASRNGRAEVEPPAVIQTTGGLRPFQIETRAKTIAAKAFLGDLLVEWKGLLR